MVRTGAQRQKYGSPILLYMGSGMREDLAVVDRGHDAFSKGVNFILTTTNSTIKLNGV